MQRESSLSIFASIDFDATVVATDLLIHLGLIISPVGYQVAYGEIMNWLSIRINQRLMDTQHYDVTALLGTLDSRASFAATRLTGMEQIQQQPRERSLVTLVSSRGAFLKF